MDKTKLPIICRSLIPKIFEARAESTEQPTSDENYSNAIDFHYRTVPEAKTQSEVSVQGNHR